MGNRSLLALSATGRTVSAPSEAAGALCTEDGVRVGVRDTGPGPSPEKLERLFEPFYATRLNGMGMGLSICRSIVEAHGGRLISIGGATNSPQRSFPGVGYLVQHVLHARGLRGAVDIAFRLQAVVALVSEISGDGAGFFLQTSEEGDFVVREDIRHRGPPFTRAAAKHQTVAL
jgi:hypothetical protein